MENSRIGITGGLGFVGAAIAERLLTAGAGSIVLFDVKTDLPSRLQPYASDKRLLLEKLDISDYESCLRAIKGCDYVFHQAGLRVTKCAKEPYLANQIMGQGSFNIVLASAENKVKKLVFASSAIVYGEPLALPLKEDHPTHDTTLYGHLKASTENLLRSFKHNYGLDYAALRYFNVYGPGMNLWGSEIEVLIRWLDRIDQGLPPLVNGDGSQTLDWIYIDDIAEANVKALIAPVSGEIFNVCTGVETSVLEILNLLLKVSGSSLKPEFQASRAVNQVARRFGCPVKAESLLGFKAKTRLEDGLKRLVEWRRQALAAGSKP